ncbi:MAG: 30S ribosome-binding factor RbfA [Ardenticatenales bacterium]|jgi:ribosome-binding factor A|nr:30S ribosome-binding factor RbfA [Ardenticatenales bacterium]
MPTIRQKRVADQIRSELSDLFLRQTRDPRLGQVTVTDVTIDRDLAYADVYVHALAGEERRSEVMDALEHAKGFLRRGIGARVRLRRTPELRFFWDPSLARGERIAQLLDTLAVSAASPEMNSPEEEE